MRSNFVKITSENGCWSIRNVKLEVLFFPRCAFFPYVYHRSLRVIFYQVIGQFLSLSIVVVPESETHTDFTCHFLEPHGNEVSDHRERPLAWLCAQTDVTICFRLLLQSAVPKP